jgi:hypothetical protein
MNPAPRPETGSLLIVQRVEKRGPIAVELTCGCVLVYQRWLRESGALPLRVADILLVVSADADRVSLRPSIGAEAETPTYFIHGEPTLEQTCEGHGAGRTA